MTGKPDFDVSAAHKYFAVDCFNRAWGLIDQPQRTPAEDAMMIHLSLASLWHWTQREDCTPTNLSIGYWQAARVYALAGQADSARRYAHLCREVSQGDAVLPFYRGYVYEALARAESVAGNAERTVAYLAEAHRVADTLPDPEARQHLLDDLATIRVVSLETLEQVAAPALTERDRAVQALERAGLIRPLAPDRLERYTRPAPEERESVRRELAARRFSPPLSEQIIQDRGACHRSRSCRPTTASSTPQE